MTVSELITELQKLPLDYTIEVFDYDHGVIYPLQFVDDDLCGTAIFTVNQKEEDGE